MVKYLSILFLTLAAISCYKEEDFSFEKLQEKEVILDIVPSKNSLIANGIDTIQIHVLVPKNADNELASVNITTTLGTFLNGEKKVAGQPKIALLNGEKKRFFSATLQAGTKTGKNTITAEVANVKKQSSIDFTQSIPSAIQITPSALSLVSSLASELDVMVALTTTSGSVNESYPFSLLALDTLNQTIGTFRVKTEQCLSNDCLSKFAIVPDTAYTGVVKFRAVTDGVAGTILEEVIIYVTK